MATVDLYLPQSRSGIAWMLDPASSEVSRVADAALATKAGTPCDYGAVADDMDALADLIAVRHFGVAAGIVDGEPAQRLLRDAARRCREEHPRTWGEAWGTTADDVRLALRDRHFQVTGAPPSLLRVGEPVFALPGKESAVAVEQGDGVCWIRLARLDGDASDIEELKAWVAQAPQHFRAERIVVDLRGNGGGNDGFVAEWAMQGLSAPRTIPETAREWRVARKTPNAWNWAAIETSRSGTQAPMWGELIHEPSPGDVLEIEDVDAITLPAGEHPFAGDMLILTDANTASSGESSAWMLKHLFSARIAGGSSRGMIEYGNIAPYLFANSRMLVTLATKHNDYGIPVEMQGFPVDIPMDPGTITKDSLATSWTT